MVRPLDALTAFSQRLDAAVFGLVAKAASSITFGRNAGASPGWWGNWGGSWFLSWQGDGSFDYGKATNYGRANSVVQACLRAIGEAAPEPPPRVYRLDEDGEPQIEPKHPLGSLLKRPNPFLSWELLFGGYIVPCLHLDGNAYFWKERSSGGRVVGLWPLPPWHLEPAWPENPTTQTWLTGYAYRPDSTQAAILLRPEDVVHLRMNLDPANYRKGRGVLQTAYKHLFTDEEAAAFTAAMLKNFGVPGVVLSPKPVASGDTLKPTQADAERYKQQFKQKFGGDNRGEPMVMAGPMDVQTVSFSPQQMNLDRLQLLPETRIAALLGVPPIVASLQSGMEHATYNNTSGLREHFTESKLVPFWRLVQGQLTDQLVPDFDDPEAVLIQFDLSEVRALQEDMDARFKRVIDLYSHSGITQNEMRRELGFADRGPDGDLWYVAPNVTLVTDEQLVPDPAPPEPLPGQPTVPLLPAPGGDGQAVAPPPPTRAGVAANG